MTHLLGVDRPSGIGHTPLMMSMAPEIVSDEFGVYYNEVESLPLLREDNLRPSGSGIYYPVAFSLDLWHHINFVCKELSVFMTVTLGGVANVVLDFTAGPGISRHTVANIVLLPTDTYYLDRYPGIFVNKPSVGRWPYLPGSFLNIFVGHVRSAGSGQGYLDKTLSYYRQNPVPWPIIDRSAVPTDPNFPRGIAHHKACYFDGAGHALPFVLFYFRGNVDGAGSPLNISTYYEQPDGVQRGQLNLFGETIPLWCNLPTVNFKAVTDIYCEIKTLTTFNY